MEDNYLMHFKFEGNLYRTDRTADELELHLAYYPCRFPEIPIELPDGRFLRVTCWRLSLPPQVGKLEIIKNNASDYAIAELVDN